ncbi:hypothetical protein [Streptococcus oricebi]|uniref:Uncharacterized protein n=1 Tax=Streptococcus oricebi TaxID=1547447 RepID=A0ABS5B0U1_9STRE|nr:hypothetical protein [Streptococcus oricebi]MBP2622452.1 hypothetical protein [Streptococcus oricebi]
MVNFFTKASRWLASKNKERNYKQIVRQRTVLLLLVLMIEAALVWLLDDVWQLEFWIYSLLIILLFWLISALYQFSFIYMLLDAINIHVYQDYLNATKLAQSLSKKAKFIYQLGQVDLDYIQGKLQQAEERLSRIALPHRLTKRTEAFALNAYKFRLLLDMQQGRPVDLEQRLEQLSQLSAANEEVLAGIKAACDLLFAKVPNDFYEDKKSAYRLHQLQYSYFRAVNAELKGELARARQLYQDLATENPQLFIVQQAKAKLGTM